MMTNDIPTHYYEGEGRHFMTDCLTRALDACVQQRLERFVVFTGTGDGPHFVAKELLSRSEYRHLQLQVVAVTPPVGRPYKEDPTADQSRIIRAGIGPAMRAELGALGVAVVSAHLPFKEMHDGRERTSSWTRVAEAYGVLGGGFALCVQALLVACDAGTVDAGERVVVASADTAFFALAARSESFLSPLDGLLVEHIICRPMRYSISRAKHRGLEAMWAPKVTAPPQLPPAPTKSEAEAEPEPTPSSTPSHPDAASHARAVKKKRHGTTRKKRVRPKS